jgi:hypothetical protein
MSSQAALHKIRIVRGPWNAGFLDELEAASHDSEYLDQLDAASMGFNYLAKKPYRSIAPKPDQYANEADRRGVRPGVLHQEKRFGPLADYGPRVVNPREFYPT